MSEIPPPDIASDPVLEASWESFPASDPPSWYAGRDTGPRPTGLGATRRKQKEPPTAANEQTDSRGLRSGMRVLSADNHAVGRVIEVFSDIGLIESFGAVGIPPQQEGHDPVRYAYSEAMPGAGDNYFTVRQRNHRVLYIPFAQIWRVNAASVKLAVDAENVPAMDWTVRPDALTSIAHEYPVDTGADPMVA